MKIQTSPTLVIHGWQPILGRVNPHYFHGALQEKCIKHTQAKMKERTTYKYPESSHCWMLSCLEFSVKAKETYLLVKANPRQ